MASISATTFRILLTAGLLFWMPNLTADTARPDLALWLNIKRALLGENGSEFFEKSFKNALVPGGANGVRTFKATLVSATPSSKPMVLLVAVSDHTTPEATLNLSGSLKKSVKPGAEVEFQGVPVAFSRAPFMVTFDVSVNDVKFDGSER